MKDTSKVSWSVAWKIRKVSYRWCRDPDREILPESRTATKDFNREILPEFQNRINKAD